MICCNRCFNDIEIRSIIEGLDNHQEECPLCRSNDVYIYDTNNHNELVGPFSEFLSIYSSHNEIRKHSPAFNNFSSLREELTDTWNIFNINKERVLELVQSICPDFYEDNKDLFSNSVAVREYTQESYLENNSLLRCRDWDDFVNEITSNIRFNIDLINKEVFANVLSYFTSIMEIDSTPVYYRGRVVDKMNYKVNEMGAPPKDKAKDGRASPKGIPCLYLADSLTTSAKEIRAGLHDKITIGTFRLTKKLKIIDLVNIDKVSPFSIDNVKSYYVNKRHLKRIGEELSKTLRNNSSELEYLPTQYISDFIKSKGYDGIKFKSTLNPNGYNLAIFDVDAFVCHEVVAYKIDSVAVSLERV